MKYWHLFAIVFTIAAPGELRADARSFLKKPAAWFATEEARMVADHIRSWQAECGAWPKNVDTTAAFAGKREDLKGTFDNGATTDELRFLAHRIAAANAEVERTAFEHGLAHILAAQYANGGWPQSFPPGKGYARYITFNDNAMVRLLEFLREVARDERYRFVPALQRQAAQEAFDRGIACILRCQIKVDGKLTAWCAQHDEQDFSPRPARSFELASLSGSESVGIVRLLMSLDKPTPAIVQAVDAAVAWFETVKLTGIRQEIREDAAAPKGRNKVIIMDPKAPPLWGRFYAIGTNKPIFADRDGIARANLADLGYERRNGYAWLGAWPQALLDTEYPAWKKRVGANKPEGSTRLLP